MCLNFIHQSGAEAWSQSSCWSHWVKWGCVGFCHCHGLQQCFVSVFVLLSSVLSVRLRHSSSQWWNELRPPCCFPPIFFLVSCGHKIQHAKQPPNVPLDESKSPNEVDIWINYTRNTFKIHLRKNEYETVQTESTSSLNTCLWNFVKCCNITLLLGSWPTLHPAGQCPRYEQPPFVEMIHGYKVINHI